MDVCCLLYTYYTDYVNHIDHMHNWKKKPTLQTQKHKKYKLAT